MVKNVGQNSKQAIMDFAVRICSVVKYKLAAFTVNSSTVTSMTVRLKTEHVFMQFTKFALQAKQNDSSPL